jgi:hypothetical protein
MFSLSNLSSIVHLGSHAFSCMLLSQSGAQGLGSLLISLGLGLLPYMKGTQKGLQRSSRRILRVFTRHWLNYSALHSEHLYSELAVSDLVSRSGYVVAAPEDALDLDDEIDMDVGA